MTEPPPRRWPRAAHHLVLAVVLLIVASACSGEAEPGDEQLSFDEQAEDGSDADGGEPETPTTSSTTSTSEAPTTETTLTQEQEDFLEAVELADRLMVPIREYQATRAACQADPPNCDLDALSEHVVADFVDANVSDIERRVADREFVVDPNSEVYFYRHTLSSESPLYAEVWTCQIRGAAFYILDADGNRVEETPADPQAGFILYGVAEEDDGALRIDQLKTLSGPDDPKPEGGTCDAYTEWPPPLPSP